MVCPQPTKRIQNWLCEDNWYSEGKPGGKIHSLTFLTLQKLHTGTIEVHTLQYSI